MEIYDCMEGVTLVQPEGRENGERVPDNGDSKTTTGPPISAELRQQTFLKPTLISL